MDSSQENNPNTAVPETLTLDATSHIDWYPNFIDQEQSNRIFQHLMNDTMERSG